jgi:tetratricopeptide (TPR) repeat protein
MTMYQEELHSIIDRGKKGLGRLSGNRKLATLLNLIRTLKPYSTKAAEELIDNNIDLIERTRSEAAALLLGEKAYLAYRHAVIADSEKYAELTLRVSRDMKSLPAEALACIVKGYLDSKSGRHKLATAWYMMALDKCTRFQRPLILLELSSSFGKRGEYDRALFFIHDAIKQSAALSYTKGISAEARMTQRQIHTDAWSRLGTLRWNIGDIDGAFKAFDHAIELSLKHKLIWERYKSLSRKARLLVMTNNVSEGERLLVEAQSLPLSGFSPKSSLYIAHAWARLYRLSSRYIESMDKYGELIFGTSSDAKRMEKHIYMLMTEYTDLFGELLSGIQECLVKLKRRRHAEMVASATREYEETIDESGIYKEMDKPEKLRIQQQNLFDILATIFEKQPLLVRYKDILAEYDREKEKAKVIIDKTEFILQKPAFLMFKYLVDHKDNCVSVKQLAAYWRENSVNYDEENDMGAKMRTYIQRYIRNKLGLDQFLRNCSKPEGWLLLP